MLRIAVAASNFSQNPILREELLAEYPDAWFHDEYELLTGDKMIAFLADADAAITALEPMDATIFGACPKLKVISKFGVGVNMLNLDDMVRCGVRLGWTGGVNKRAVSELALGYMLSALRHIPVCDRNMRAGDTWNRIKGQELSAQTVGIIGCGHIGKDLVRLLAPFGCRILVNDILDFPEFYAEHAVEAVALDDLLREADIVTVHTPLNETTYHLIGADELALMKSTAIVLNTARGGIIDEAALKKALVGGGIGYAGIDVFEKEPAGDAELLNLPNVISTPHVGGTTAQGNLAMGRAAIAGLKNNRLPDAGWPAR